MVDDKVDGVADVVIDVADNVNEHDKSFESTVDEKVFDIPHFYVWICQKFFARKNCRNKNDELINKVFVLFTSGWCVFFLLRIFL